MKVVLDEGAFMPEYAHDTDAGMDLRSPIDVMLPAKRNEAFGNYEEANVGCVAIDTGVHVELPTGTVGFLKSKSGLNVKHHIVSEGVIDEGYTGSIVVKLYNRGVTDYFIHRGDKITQMVVLPYSHVDIERVDELESTSRGDSGFGSTGI